jgi:hypothetical protein
MQFPVFQTMVNNLADASRRGLQTQHFLLPLTWEWVPVWS